MTLAACWVLFPLVLLALTLGCGLLVERLSGRRLPGAVLPAVGFCVMAIVGQFTSLADSTAELAAPIAISLAFAGVMLSSPWKERRVDPWAVACALGAFVLYGAPVLLSGEATFAGYIRLDDTASWLALAERAVEQGSNVTGLAPSTHEATLDFYLNSDYPLGGLVPLAVGGDLVGQDLAWVWQPYLSALAAMLALGLYAALGGVALSSPLRAAMAFVAAQPALVVGYALWGGFKEVAAAGLIVVLAVLASGVLSPGSGPRRLIPVAVTTAGMLALLSVGGLIWIAPALLPMSVAWLRDSRPLALRSGLRLGGLIALLAVPTILAAGFLGAPASSTVTDQDRLANLIQPLSALQVFGIWPAGDFRLRPDELGVTYVLIAVMAVAALLGALWAWRQRHQTLLMYGGAAIGGCFVVYALGSPWVDAKALTVGSPAVVLAAVAGAAHAYRSGRRVEGVALATAVVGGLVWSNVLAYHTANLAPRDRMAELDQIGRRYAGRGPTLMTEYEPYGARYFLRDADPESAGELRRRYVRLRNGRTVPKGGHADLDRFSSSELLQYQTLVLRRSPVESRPPSLYDLSWRGRHYEVWERTATPSDALVEHLPLGGGIASAAVPNCATIRRLARRSNGSTRLGSQPRRPVAVAPLDSARLPASWPPDNRRPGSVRPTEEGTAHTAVSVQRPGRYDVWLGGSVRGAVEVDVGGRRVGVVKHSLSYSGHYVPVGAVDLPQGRHPVSIHYGAGDLRPGSGGGANPIGPLVLTVAGESRDPVLVPPDRGERLCGQLLDWVELLRY